MPSSDYASAVSGGLKLKGAKDAGIKKKSKKSKSSKDKAPEATNSEEVAGSGGSEAAAPSDKTLALTNTPSDPERDTTPSTAGTGTGKTEAQRRHEEIKRKRLDDRLKREGGAKTHKQRVEELNKYLSTLSEHHDMPRIGPG